MTREEALNKAINIVRYFEANFAKSKEARENAAKIIEALSQEPICPSHGIDCEDCPAYKPCDYAISRQAVLEIAKSSKSNWIDNSVLFKRVNELPPVNPQPKTGHCRDCKWWKDSDGLYRRDSHAESQCPINRREVFEGNGYCYMFEPQKSEEEHDV